MDKAWFSRFVAEFKISEKRKEKNPKLVVKGVIGVKGVKVNSQRSAYLSEERRVKSEKSKCFAMTISNKAYVFFRYAQGISP